MKERSSRAPYPALKKIIRMIIIVVIIGLLVNIAISFFFDFRSLSANLGKAGPQHILVPFAVYILIYFIDSLRLKLVLRQCGCRIKTGDAFVNSLMGYFFAHLTPMATGGQPFQIYHLKKLGIDAKTSTNVIMSRFVEYLGSAIIITLLFLPGILPLFNELNFQTAFLAAGFSLSVAASAIVTVLFIRPDWIGALLARIEHTFLGRFISRFVKRKNWGKAAHEWSRELKKSIRALWKKKFGVMLVDIALCVVILGLQAFSLAWVLLTLLGASIGFFQVFSIVLLLNLVVYYIPSPGAAGALESVYTAVFARYAHDPLIAIALWRFATYYLQIFFGLGVFLLMRRRGILSHAGGDETRPEGGSPPAAPDMNKISNAP